MTASQLLIIDVQTGFINEWTAHVPDARRFVAGQLRSGPGHAPLQSAEVTLPQADRLERLLSRLGRHAARLRAPAGRHDYRQVDLQLRKRRLLSIACAATVIARVHLCGIGTDSSVLMSAVDLFQAGIEPVVLAHACASVSGHVDHQAGLQILRRLIGEKQVIGS